MRRRFPAVLAALLFAAAVALAPGGPLTAARQALASAQAPISDQTINAVSVVDSAHEWAVAAGVVLESTDGGGTWRTVDEPPGQPRLSGVSFPDAGHGWAVGPKVLLATSDGGGTWAAQNASGTAVFFLDDKHGWLAGPGGDEVTVDGGATWTAGTLPAGFGTDYLTGIDFVDELHGWAVGNTGDVLSSSDGGLTWTIHTAAARTSLIGLTAVSFADLAHGWAVGGDSSSGVVFATGDGGQTWTQQGAPPASTYAGVEAAASGDIWIAGGAVAAHSRDGGATWTSAQVSRVSFNGVASRGGAVALAGAAGCGMPSLLTSPDGGSTWNEGLPQVPQLSVLQSLSFVDGSHGWAAGALPCGGALLKTSDAGVHWDYTQASAASTTALVDVKFATSQVGWVISNGIYKTADGGASWSAQTVPGGSAPAHLAVVPGDTADAWAVGASILRTTDGGATWSSVALPAGLTSVSLRTISFPDSADGWIGGYNNSAQAGLVLHSVDGGATWAAQTLPATCAIGAVDGVDFIDANHGWAVGFGGGIETGDGGATWTSMCGAPSGGALAFADSSHGWAGGGYCGQPPLLAGTADGGSSWTSETPPAGTSILLALDALDASHAVGVGQTGSCSGAVAMTTADAGATWSPAALPTFTETHLTISPATAMRGQIVVLRAAVRTLPWAPVAAGMVTFSDQFGVVGSAPVDSSGVATFSTTSLQPPADPQPYEFTAIYAPATSFVASTSSTAALTVTYPNSGSGWTARPGQATDIAAGGGQVFALGTNTVPGGHGLWRWAGSGWSSFPGGGISLAVDASGDPWVVNDAGQIWRWSGSSWQRVAGSAHYVAAGQDGSVYVLGTDVVAGGYGIWRYGAGGWNHVSGGAVDLSVGTDGSLWAANTAQGIWRLQAGAWVQVWGAAVDTGGFDGADLWVLGNDSVPGGRGIWFWNGSGWASIPGGAADIAWDPATALPWVVNASGAIYERG